MKHGSHPGLVPLLDASRRTDPHWLRYEFIPGGNLLLLFNIDRRLLENGAALSQPALQKAQIKIWLEELFGSVF